jgi:hypothetical protein
VLAEPLESAVIEMIFLALDDGAFSSTVHLRGQNTDEMAEKAIKEMEAARIEMNEVDEMLGLGEISRGSYVEVTRKIQKRIETAESQIPSNPNSDALRLLSGGVSSLRSSWENLPIDAQRSIVSLLIESIPINPAIKGQNFFSAHRIGNPVWRL